MLIVHFTDGLDILYITLGLDTVRSEAPTVKFTHKHTHTYDVQREVAAAAHVSRCVLGAAVVQAVVVRTGALDGERPLLVVDLMAPLTQLCAVLEPLARRPASEINGESEKVKLNDSHAGGPQKGKGVRGGLTVDAHRCDSAT